VGGRNEENEDQSRHGFGEVIVKGKDKDGGGNALARTPCLHLRLVTTLLAAH
jgi:hypothetical protein